MIVYEVVKCKKIVMLKHFDIEYNKKKIQIFGMIKTFISSSEAKKKVYFIHGFATHEIYIFFAALDEINKIYIFCFA